MKKFFLVMAVFLSTAVVWAEDDHKTKFSIGADLVSSYVWRGMYCAGTSIQPAMNLTVGGFTFGAWGSVDVADTGFGAYKEVDLMASYSFGSLTIGLFNYWISWEGGQNYFDFSEDTDHVLEVNLLYSFGSSPFSLGWNTIIAGSDHYLDLKNNESKRAFSTYVEATYASSIKDVDIELALGVSPWKSNVLYTNGWRDRTDGFAVVNTSLTASKDIKINDGYSLGIFSQLSFNPENNDAFLVFGICF